MTRHLDSARALLLGCALILVAVPLAAQQPTPWTPLKRGSDNIEVLGHIPMGMDENISDMDIEQELDRPYAYIARASYIDGPIGMAIVDFSDPENPTEIFDWTIENSDLTAGGARDGKYFKWEDRYYVVQSFQLGQGGPNSDLGAVVFDVTGLPDASTVREVARIREPEMPGGFHNIFIYKHSDDRVYLFTTARGPGSLVYDLGRVVSGDVENARIGMVPVPESAAGSGGNRGYHDFYVGYHPDTGEDRFYGGGTGGYYIYDVTNLDDPQLRHVHPPRHQVQGVPSKGDGLHLDGGLAPLVADLDVVQPRPLAHGLSRFGSGGTMRA